MTSFPPFGTAPRQAGMSWLRIAPLLLILAASVPVHGTAQNVTGTVVEQGTGKPVPGAMVLLVDRSGTRVDRALADAAGRFALHARASGFHHVEVERIGYAGWATRSVSSDRGRDGPHSGGSVRSDLAGGASMCRVSTVARPFRKAERPWCASGRKREKGAGDRSVHARGGHLPLQAAPFRSVPLDRNAPECAQGKRSPKSGYMRAASHLVSPLNSLRLTGSSSRRTTR